MKKSEIHDAAKSFVTEHANYIDEWFNRWESAIEPYRQNETLTTTGRVEHPDWDTLTPEEIADFFNTFWMRLPDSLSIRGFGFGTLCDIAENVFGFEDDEETPEPQST